MKRGFNELENEKTQKSIVDYLQKLRSKEKSNIRSPQKILEENIKNVEINDKNSPKIAILIEASQENNNEVTSSILNIIKMGIFTLLIRYCRKKHRENRVMKQVKKK